MTYTVFDATSKKKKKLMFLDPEGGVTIARTDKAAFPIFTKLIDKQNGFMWRPTEVDTSKDRSDFKTLTPTEQHIFTSNLKRQILLDTITARSPVLAFIPFCSQPEVEEWIQTWVYFETIHSRSYSHIIKDVYPNPGVVFDEITEIQEIVDCATDISRYYDDVINYGNLYNLFGEGTFADPRYDGSVEFTVSKYELKKKIYLAMMSANVLEGVRFYVSFACSWAFFEQKKAMEGNAKLIKLICRDENIHLAATQHMLKEMRNSDPDFAKIAKETQQECVEMFRSVLVQEKAWAKYLFKDGSMLGLNYEMMEQYLEWLVYKRTQAIGLEPIGKGGANPLPWTTKWIGGTTVQVANQETEATAYTMGGVKQDVSETSFSGFSL